MAYFSPYIDETGLHLPTYTDIRDDLLSQAREIFGADTYLEEDSMDYQYISVLANRIYSCYQLAQTVYNNRTPVMATGTGLDAIVQINGLTRKPATYTTVGVTVMGTAGTVINSGVVADIDDNRYNLPQTVTIPSSGKITVTATAQQTGALQYAPGQIVKIVTPVTGWDGVTNPAATLPGRDVETDGELRARQADSVSLSSQTVFEGTLAEIMGLPGVLRAKGYENTSGAVDDNGIPGHSICMVVEGGKEQEIAEAIYSHKTPGCGTYGETQVNVASIYGFETPICYQKLKYVDIRMNIGVKALSDGFTTEVQDKIKNQIIAYLNDLQIGDDVIVSSLWYAALLAQPDPLSPVFSITNIKVGLEGGTVLTANDLVIPFDSAAAITKENVHIVVVS